MRTAATLLLALCIGANTSVFSIVDSILIRPLPYPDSGRIYWIDEHMGPAQNASVAPDYFSMRAQNRVFEELAAYETLAQNWSGGDQPEQLDAALVSASFFRVMAQQPMLGRYLAAEEEGPNAPPVAVVSYAFWRNRLGGNAGAIGSKITLDGAPNTIIGVMPQGFDYPRGTQIWRPWRVDRETQSVRLITAPIRVENVVARLKPGVTEQELNTETARLTELIRREYPIEFVAVGALTGMRITAQPLQQLLTGDVRPALALLSGAVGLVLLIACANVASLMLARASAQQHETAVRLALGCSRARIAGRMLWHSVKLALPGGLAGIALTLLAVRILNAVKPLPLVRYPEISLDVRVLLFTLGLTLLTGVIFGIAPAIAAADTNIQETLKSTGMTHSGGRGRLRRYLVIAELSVSLILLIGAGLLARSFLKLASVDVGFPADHLLTMRFRLSGATYANTALQVQFFDDVVERVEHLPGVTAAAVTYRIPAANQFPSSARFQVEGRPPVPLARQPESDTNLVSRDFFKTLGVPLRAGRIFDTQDSPDSPDAVVINQAFARKIFAGEDPVGKRLLMTGRVTQTWTIVGVVGDIRGQELGANPAPMLYRCTCQGGSIPLMGLLVRTTADPETAARSVEEQIYSVDRNQPVFDVKTMEQRLEDSLAPQRFQLAVIGGFAALAMAMAAAGVYGMMSFFVTRRTREIGIRMALGARTDDVLKLVLGEGLNMAIVAAGIGLIGAAGLTRYVQSLLYGLSAVDPLTYVLMFAALLAIVTAACWGPARRAAGIEPVKALRAE